MKVSILLLTLVLTSTAFAGWRAETRKTLKEFKNECNSSEVTIDSIVKNDMIKGHVTGLSAEAMDQFKVVFYVKTNVWHVHAYTYYEGQQEGYSFSNIDSNGNFKIKTVFRGLPASYLAVSVVPKTFKIKRYKFWKKPFLGIGGVLKFSCTHDIINGNGDF